jgi:hypothetical protein
MMTSRSMGLMVALLVVLPLSMPSSYGADEADRTIAVDSAEESHSPGIGHKLLFYIPNRARDLIDIIRLRLRVGPGLSAGVRATERLAFFGGKYRTAYIGLPGPRAPKKFVSPVGLESAKGMVFAGVDATDNSKHPPGYSESEIAVGLQVLIAGGEAGIDFVEIADFFTGLILIDLRKDDL